MLDILLVLLFVWIFWNAAKLAFRVAWGTTKIIAALLFAIACPALMACLLFAGGLVLLFPIALVSIAFGLLKACL